MAATTSNATTFGDSAKPRRNDGADGSTSGVVARSCSGIVAGGCERGDGLTESSERDEGALGCAGTAARLFGGAGCDGPVAGRPGWRAAIGALGNAGPIAGGREACSGAGGAPAVATVRGPCVDGAREELGACAAAPASRGCISATWSAVTIASAATTEPVSTSGRDGDDGNVAAQAASASLNARASG